MKREELKLCGLVAVRMRFARDPGSIKRLYFDEATGRKVGPICKALATARKVYRQVEPAELEKVAATVHHGGVVAVVDAPELVAPTPQDVRRWAARSAPVVLLDRIGNAHNLGAIARTAAFFGVGHIVIPDDPMAALPGEAAYRVSEGGLEHLSVWRVRDLAKFARELAAAGYEVVGAATRGGAPEQVARGGKPVALVMGNEETGLSPVMSAACTQRVTIRGSGKVESLNVSVAAAVLLHALLAGR